MFDQSLTESEATTPAEVLKEIKEKVDKLYELKVKSDEAEKLYKDAKNELTDILEKAGVDKVQGDTCTVSLQLKTSCSVPKDLAKKKELFQYIKDNHGEEVLRTMLTINARTFSSWHDKEIESKIEETGDVEFKLGMVEPYSYFSLGMRKRTKK